MDALARSRPSAAIPSRAWRARRSRGVRRLFGPDGRPRLRLRARTGPERFPWLTGREQEDLILYRPRFIDAATAALPRHVEKSFGMAPGIFAAYPEPAAFAVSVTTPGGQTWPVDSVS